MGGKIVIRPTANKGIVFLGGGDKSSPPVVTLADGKTVTGKYKNTENGQHQFTFGLSAQEAQGATFSYGGVTTKPLDFGGGQHEYRTENGGLGGIDQAPNKALRGGGSVGGGAGGGGYAAGKTSFGGGYAGNQAIPSFTDASSLAFQPVSVPSIPTPGYAPIDPQVYSQQVGGQNRSEYLNNLGLSQNAALGFTQTEQQGLNNFAPGQEALQQALVGQENQFNQGQIQRSNAFNPSQVSYSNRFNQFELDNSINSSGLPIRDVITEGLARARQLAKGFLPTTIEDRAFEQAARAKAGDDAVTRGLGTSSFTQNAIDKYTIGERLNLMDYGSGQVDKYLNQGVKLLIDSPIKYNPLLSSPLGSKVSQDIHGNPSFSIGGAQAAEQSNIGQLTTFTPGASLSLFDQQRQYRAQLENNVNQYNAGMSFNSQTFNSTGNFNQQLTQLSNDQLNAKNSYNFAQGVANSVNSIYQQQLATYANSVGYGRTAFQQTPLTYTNSGIAPTVYNQPRA